MSEYFDRQVRYGVLFLQDIHEEYIKGNKIIYFAFLAGLEGIELPSNPGSGHSFQVAISAINKKYIVDPRVKDGFCDALDFILTKSSSYDFFELGIDCVLYQFKLAYKGKATFDIPYEYYFNKFVDAYNKNKDLFIKEYPDIEEWMASDINDFNNYKEWYDNSGRKE